MKRVFNFFGPQLNSSKIDVEYCYYRYIDLQLQSK